VIAAPYLGRTPRAMSGKLRVLQRGTDMVLAEHYTPVHDGRLTAVTLETVTFDRPHRIAFRLVRGPVPYITEQFALTEHDGTTSLDYSGELGTDFGIAGQWWADRVAAAWEAAVRSSFAGIRTEAERRARPGTASACHPAKGCRLPPLRAPATHPQCRRALFSGQRPAPRAASAPGGRSGRAPERCLRAIGLVIAG